jgi:hypothetical protein
VTQGNKKYILTFQDVLSKHVVAVPIGQQDAETVARAFVANIVLKYGTPRILQTDQDANFISEVFRNTCKILKIKKVRFISNRKGVLRGAIVCWLSTTDIMSRIRPIGMSGFLSQPTCIIPPYNPLVGLPPLSCCSDAPPP